jgi:hypothetical protein
VKIHVDAWDPSYGVAFEGSDGPQAQSTAQIQPDVELPAAAWRPVDPPPGLSPPGTVLVVDGVQRIDARVWVTDDDGLTHPGIAASYGAGVVCCELDRGAATVATVRIERGLFTPLETAPPIGAGMIRYAPRRVSRGEPKDLALGVQRHMRALEVAVSNEERADGDLLIVDGPLQERAHLPRALGYIKTHRVEYLPAELTAVVTALRGGQRSPVFLLGTSWNRFAWYLRLPGPAGSPWAGIVRAECAADLTPGDAVALAHLSAVTLPRFASSAYKDPRAPQNLIPIAGLERKLRAMLGDARLLHRALAKSTARSVA